MEDKETNETVQNLSYDELVAAIDRAGRAVKLVDGAYRTPSGSIVANAVNYQQSGRWCLMDGYLRTIGIDWYDSPEEALEAAREMIEASPQYELID